MKRPAGKSSETPAEKAEKVRQAAAAVAKSRQERLKREEDLLVQARHELAAAGTSSAEDETTAAKAVTKAPLVFETMLDAWLHLDTVVVKGVPDVNNFSNHVWESTNDLIQKRTL